MKVCMCSKPLLIPWINWALATLFVVLVFAFQTSYAITNQYIVNDLYLTNHDIALVGSIYVWTFALSQLFSGSLLDRQGPRILSLACFILSIGILFFSQSQSLFYLGLAKVLIAIGASFAFIGAGFIGGLWFPKYYGLLFACVQFTVSTSAFFTQRLFTYYLKSATWNSLLIYLSSLALICAVLMFFLIRTPESSKKRSENRKKISCLFMKDILISIKTVLCYPKVVLNLIIGAISFAPMLAIGVVLGINLLQIKGASIDTSQKSIALSWLGLAFGAPIFAYLSDRFMTRKYMLFISLLGQVLTLLIVMFFLNLNEYMYILVMFIFGFFAGGSMIPFTIGSELVSKKYIGTSAALVNGSQFALSGIFMSAPSVLVRYGFFDSIDKTYWLIPLVIFLSALLTLLLPETIKHNNIN